MSATFKQAVLRLSENLKEERMAEWLSGVLGGKKRARVWINSQTNQVPGEFIGVYWCLVYSHLDGNPHQHGPECECSACESQYDMDAGAGF